MTDEQAFDEAWKELKHVQEATLKQLDVLEDSLRIFTEDLRKWTRTNRIVRGKMQDFRKDMIDIRQRLMGLLDQCL